MEQSRCSLLELARQLAWQEFAGFRRYQPHHCEERRLDRDWCTDLTQHQRSFRC